MSKKSKQLHTNLLKKEKGKDLLNTYYKWGFGKQMTRSTKMSKTAKINVKSQIGFHKMTHIHFTKGIVAEIPILSFLKPEDKSHSRAMTVPVDLIDKRIHHLWLVDGEEEWFDDTVL